MAAMISSRFIRVFFMIGALCSTVRASAQSIVELDRLETSFQEKCVEEMGKALDVFDHDQITELCGCLWGEMQVLFSPEELDYMAINGLFSIVEKEREFIAIIQQCGAKGALSKLQSSNRSEAFESIMFGIRQVKSNPAMFKDMNLIASCEQVAKGLLTNNSMTDEQVSNYCHSTHQQILQTEFDFIRYDELTDLDLKKIYRIYQNAATFALHGDSSTFGNNSYVQGAKSSDTVLLSDHSTVNVQLGTKTYAMKIDLLRYETLISEEVEQELLSLSILNAMNSFGTIDYQTSVSTIRNCRMYELPSLRIGEFVVTSIPVVVVQNSPTILGKSALKRFDHFELNDQQLILFR
jgi:hypothetical protein